MADRPGKESSLFVNDRGTLRVIRRGDRAVTVLADLLDGGMCYWTYTIPSGDAGYVLMDGRIECHGVRSYVGIQHTRVADGVPFTTPVPWLLRPPLGGRGVASLTCRRPGQEDHVWPHEGELVQRAVHRAVDLVEEFVHYSEGAWSPGETRVADPTVSVQIGYPGGAMGRCE